MSFTDRFTEGPVVAEASNFGTLDVIKLKCVDPGLRSASAFEVEEKHVRTLRPSRIRRATRRPK